MVEINNQRKEAFLDMHSVVGGELITDVRKPEILSCDVIVGGELLLITPITLANTSR